MIKQLIIIVKTMLEVSALKSGNEVSALKSRNEVAALLSHYHLSRVLIIICQKFSLSSENGYH